MSISVESPLSGHKLEARVRERNDAQPPLDESLLKLNAEQLDLFRSTLPLDDEQLRKHVLEVQKEVYECYRMRLYFASDDGNSEEFPYTCIRVFSNLSFYISKQPVYQEVVNAGKVKDDALFLDIGCCTGSESRKLVFDGYPGKSIYASDLHGRYLELGYKLFNDKDSCRIIFFPADIFSLQVTAPVAGDFSVEDSPFEKFRGRATHIYTGLFFHLFDELTQREVARRLATLIDRRPGSIIFGFHAGKEPAGPVIRPPNRITFAHSPSTFTSLWKSVFTELGGGEFANNNVVVDATLRDSGEFWEELKGHSVLIWSVKIV